MAIQDVMVNYWAVLSVAIIHLLIGSYWYSFAGFGKSWMKYSGLVKQKLDAAKKRGMVRAYILSFVAALVLNFVLAHFVKYAAGNNFVEGMFIGFLLWVGFFVTTMIGTIIWEGRSYKLYLIHIGYYLVSLLLSGGILAVWS